MSTPAWYTVTMSFGESFTYALLAGILPSAVWLWFWLREDSHPEPRMLLASTFVGGIFAVVAAIFIEKYIGSMVFDREWQYTLWAATEEILKFIAVVCIALPSRSYDEPIDAMVYCIVAALGFAALENTFFVMGPLSNGQIAQSIISDNMRFIGATLVHIASSATVGAALGFAFYRGYLAKAIAVICGLAAAISLHTAFNISIISSAGWGDTLRTFAWFWGAIIILMVLFEEVKAVQPRTL